MAANHFRNPGYHKGYSNEQRRVVDRQRKKDERVEKRTQDVLEKTVIVWDGEGMNLSGPGKPQHYVLFGCSARPYNPLTISSPKGFLSFEMIADYCMDVVKQYPNALHLGYYFRYDQNMIIWSLPWPAKQVLYSTGSCMINRGKTKYYVRCIFGKRIVMTRVDPQGEKLSIRIEDFAPFFASSFVNAYEKLFKQPTNPANWEIVKQGKADRAVMLYNDMGRVTRYWRAEILALQELAEEFRRLMFEADFYLNEWHGPGALANYVRRNYDLVRHEWGGKEENLPPAVHEAAKGAFYGGHFEQYKMGRIQGPIHSYDINSAYPHAFTEIPSLREGGQWQHVGAVPTALWRERRNPIRTSFGVFYVRWDGRSSNQDVYASRRIQPLPHRSAQGNISYPPVVEGWYWAPEVLVADMVAQQRKLSLEILDGWVWEPADDTEWPWEDLFQSMYQRRKRLQQNKNPVQMAFKLALNSLYGKMAQRAGGKESAPRSHTLPIAGYVTSSCRAKVMLMMHYCKPDSVISVETDGVYTTTPPEDLPSLFRMSDALGDWGHDVYDDMILLQNGVYLTSQNGAWKKPKTRGIAPHHFQHDDGTTNVEPTLSHLASCTAEKRWAPMTYDGGQQFLGLGTAIARATKQNVQGKMCTNPFKASDLHCTWAPDSKSIDLEGRSSKRSHYPKLCRACQEGLTPDISEHDMMIHSEALKSGESMSTAYQLPWEKGYEEPQWQIMERAEGIPDVSDLEMI